MSTLKSEDDILRDALALPEQARAALAEKLLASLDSADQRDIDARWAREAEDRIEAFERGEIPAIPGNEVFASLKSRSNQ